jgi:hypothetical protein
MYGPDLGGIPRRQLIGYLRRVVGRSIVDDNHLDRAVGLCQHARNGFSQHCATIEDGNDCRN